MNFLAKIKEIEQNIEKDSKSNQSGNFDKNKLRNLSIERFSQMNIAIEIRSKVLEENIWFCSNEEMVKQISEDDPTTICYTADELQKIIELDPSEGFLRKIHNTKTIFENSKIIQTINKKKTDYD